LKFWHEITVEFIRMGLKGYYKLRKYLMGLAIMMIS